MPGWITKQDLREYCFEYDRERWAAAIALILAEDTVRTLNRLGLTVTIMDWQVLRDASDRFNALLPRVLLPRDSSRPALEPWSPPHPRGRYMRPSTSTPFQRQGG